MSTTSMRRSRIVAALAAPALILSGLAAGPANADPTPSNTSGASWLADELNDQNLMYNAQFDFTDYGLSIDAAFAAASADDQQTLNAITNAIAANVEDYIRGGSDTDLYAGNVAKALNLAQLTGRNGNDFGGQKLVTLLEGTVTDAGADEGRIKDDTAFGDFANMIGQSFAVSSLTQAKSFQANEATDYLLSQQCDLGFFPQEFGAEGERNCNGGSASIDATAFAVIALKTRPATDRASKAALNQGIGFLKQIQKSNGSFNTDGGTDPSNSNSTGLAAAALGSDCQVREATRAGDWMRDLQVGEEELDTALAKEQGAVAFDQAAFTTGRSAGIDDTNSDQWRRATTQAVPGMAFDTGADSTVRFAGGFKRFAKKGTRQQLRIRGVAAGEQVCLLIPGDGAKTFIGDGGTIKTFVKKNRTGKFLYRATTGAGLARQKVTFVRPKLGISYRKNVQQGERQKVKVRGLGKGESVKIKVNGKRVRKGRGRANGTFVTTFRVNVKRGKTGLKFTTRDSNRKAFRTFQVR